MFDFLLPFSVCVHVCYWALTLISLRTPEMDKQIAFSANKLERLVQRLTRKKVNVYLHVLFASGYSKFARSPK